MSGEFSLNGPGVWFTSTHPIVFFFLKANVEKGTFGPHIDIQNPYFLFIFFLLLFWFCFDVLYICVFHFTFIWFRVRFGYFYGQFFYYVCLPCNKSKTGLTKRMQNDIWAKLMSEISAKSIHIRCCRCCFIVCVCWPLFFVQLLIGLQGNSAKISKTLLPIYYGLYTKQLGISMCR